MLDKREITAEAETEGKSSKVFESMERELDGVFERIGKESFMRRKWKEAVKKDEAARARADAARADVARADVTRADVTRADAAGDDITARLDVAARARVMFGGGA